MKILNAFKERTIGIEQYLRDNEYPYDFIQLCESTNINREDVIDKLLEHPIFYYRFENHQHELWDITTTPFHLFNILQAWEEDTIHPNKEVLYSWLNKL